MGNWGSTDQSWFAVCAAAVASVVAVVCWDGIDEGAGSESEVCGGVDWEGDCGLEEGGCEG